MRRMKRSRVDPWVENFGETGCLEPAFKRKTNDDDRDTITFSQSSSLTLGKMHFKNLTFSF